MRQSPPLKSAQQGAVLIEAMVAILIFSLGVLAIVGLQANMIKNVADSKYRSEASYIAQSQDRPDVGGSRQSRRPTSRPTPTSPSLLPGGTRTVTQPAAGPVHGDGHLAAAGPNETTHNFTTTARITGN